VKFETKGTYLLGPTKGTYLLFQSYGMGDLEKIGSLASEGNVVKLVRIEPTWMWSHRIATPLFTTKSSVCINRSVLQYSCILALNVLSPCLVKKKFQKSATVVITSNLTICVWSIKYRRKKTSCTVWLKIARRTF